MIYIKDLKLKRVMAYRGESFNHYSSGANGAGIAYQLVHNKGKQLVAFSLVNPYNGYDYQIFDKFMLRAGGTSSNFTAFGYMVEHSTLNQVNIICYYINSVSSPCVPIYYFLEEGTI